jgi:hypothetical protein
MSKRNFMEKFHDREAKEAESDSDEPNYKRQKTDDDVLPSEVQDLKDEMDRRAKDGPVGAQRVFGSFLDNMERDALQAERDEIDAQNRELQRRKQRHDDSLFADPLAQPFASSADQLKQEQDVFGDSVQDRARMDAVDKTRALDQEAGSVRRCLYARSWFF